MDESVRDDGTMGLQDCIVAGRAWRDGQLVDDDVRTDEISVVATDPQQLLWIDLLRPSREALAELAARLQLAPTTVEDAVAPHERPKVTRHGSTLFFTVYSAHLDAPGDSPSTGRLRTGRLSGLVLPHALITIRLDDAVPMDRVVARWDENTDLVRDGGVGALVHGLLDTVVDGHFEIIQELDDEIDLLEDELFAEQAHGREFVAKVYGFRKDLVSTIFEANLSLQDSRLNVIMKKLAAWGAIIAIPTAVTGWFGQNIPYPGFAKPLGLWLSVALIVGLAGGLYVAFRRRDWL